MRRSLATRVREDRRLAVHLAAVAGTLSISFSAVFVRLAGVSPDTSAFFRTLYALPALALAWAALRDRDARSGAERALALASGVLLALDLAFWHRTIRDIGAGLATVLANTQVAFVAAAGWVLFCSASGPHGLPSSSCRASSSGSP